MRNRFASLLFIVGFVAVGMALAIRLKREAPDRSGYDYPIEGLVVRDERERVFEPVAPQDQKMIAQLGFSKVLAQCGAALVRHLIIYRDCLYFFTADDRVLVMTVSGSEAAPRLVETKHWSGAPHDFRDYRKELLPGS
jgi:hypothetical protein